MNEDPFETLDASYVLGSLSQAERLEFEEHLLTCDACAARVADLQELPGLLALAPAWAFDGRQPGDADLVDDDPLLTLSAAAQSQVPGTLLPRLLRQVHRERQRRRLVAVTAVVAAAACIVALVLVVLPGQRGGGIPAHAPAQAVALSNLVDAPVVAEADVVTTDTWARVDLWCTYNGGSGGVYDLVARSKDGSSMQIGSWPVVPGQTVVMRVPTQLHTADLQSIDITTTSGLTVSRLSL